MSSDPRPLHVVVASADVVLLHEVAWVLEAVGYKVQTSKDLDQEALWRRYAIADFVIVDGRTIAEPTSNTFAHDSADPAYRIFLYDPAAKTDFATWYAAGAHDALRTPVSRGELLARVRTGARYLEFERRLKRQSSRCSIPNMYSRRGFLRKLRKLASSGELATAQHALVATSIDWYAGIRRRSGESASRTLVAAAARSIRRSLGEGAISAYFGDGRFATLLVGQSPAAAKAAAETLAKDFSNRESHHESVPRPTLTSAVVPWTAGSDDAMVNTAVESLELAAQSGGDCVLQQGDFAQELAAWESEMTTGNPFANVVAQDIMEPFPALLLQGSEQSELAVALRASGIPVRPYVDAEGRLVGVAANSEAAAETRIGQSQASAANADLSMPETINHDASFPEIYEAFASRGCSTLVVTAADHPLGYLTCEGFLSMIDPIDADSFANSERAADELAYLVVPSAIGELNAEALAT